MAPMGGKVINISVKIGDKVAEDDEIGVLEAMKMEMPIAATANGVVKEIKVKEGDAVDADQVLIILG
jgi:biotin carboxyl carrier protein